MKMCTYAVGAAFFVILWLVLYAAVPRVRLPMWGTGLAWGHAGPISQYWHLRDYWHPTYPWSTSFGNWRFGAEDCAFAFAFAGIATAVFESLAGRSGVKPLTEFRLRRFLALFALGLGCLGAMAGLTALGWLDSLRGITLAFLVLAAVLLWQRPELWWNAFASAWVVALVMWVFYWGFYLRVYPGLIEVWWPSGSLSGLRLAGVPVEEVIWAWAAGLFVGPALPLCMEPRETGEADRQIECDRPRPQDLPTARRLCHEPDPLPPATARAATPCGTAIYIDNIIILTVTSASVPHGARRRYPPPPQRIRPPVLQIPKVAPSGGAR